MCAVVAGKCKLFKFFKGLFMNMFLRFCDRVVGMFGRLMFGKLPNYKSVWQ